MAAFNNGCAMEVAGATSDPSAEDSEHLGTQQNAMTKVACNSAVYDNCWEKTDSSGFISTRLYQCKPSAASNYNRVITCPVESDRVLVGGGAEVLGTPSPGAMLFESWAPPPSPGSSTSWYAASKALQSPSPHQLRAYAVGLRLANYSVTQLRSAVTYTFGPGSGAPSHAPLDLAHRPANHITLSGGALAGPTNPNGGLNEGQFLYKSFPTPDGAIWIAQSKDHVVPSLGAVLSEIITIPQCPPNLGYCLISTVSSNSGVSGNGYFSVSLVNSASNSLLTGVGGQVAWQGYGRMFSQLYPNAQGSGTAVSTSKDHLFFDTSTDTVYSINLQKQ